MHHLVFAGVALAWSTSFLLMKWATDAYEPLTLAGIRVLSGAGICYLLSWAFGRGWRLGGFRLLPFAVVVVFGYLLPFTFQPYLLARYPSGFIGMIVGLVPLYTIAVSVPLLGRWPSVRELVAVVVGLGCLVLIFRDGIAREIGVGDLCLASTVPACYAISNTTLKRCFATTASLPLTAACLGVSGVLLLPVGLALETIAVEPLARATASLLFLGVVSTGLVLFGFYWLIQTRGPLFAGMVTYLIPCGALVCGWIVDEEVTLLQLLALAGIVAAVAWGQTGGAGRRLKAEG